MKSRVHDEAFGIKEGYCILDPVLAKHLYNREIVLAKTEPAPVKLRRKRGDRARARTHFGRPVCLSFAQSHEECSRVCPSYT